VEKYLPRWLLAAGILCCGCISPAQAQNDGSLCLPCVPIDFVAKLIPGRLSEEMEAAIYRGNLDKLKTLLHKNDRSRAEKALQLTVGYYLQAPQSDYFDIIQFLVEDKRVDLAGSAGTELLQQIADSSISTPAPKQSALQLILAQSMPAPKQRVAQLSLAQYAIDHGAKAQGVELKACNACDSYNDLISLLTSHGAKATASK